MIANYLTRVESIRGLFDQQPSITPQPTVPISWYSGKRPSGQNKELATQSSCYEAKTASFWDLSLRAKLGGEAYETLRAVEPTSPPWSPGQPLHDVNDLPPDHLLRGCILDFEHKDFYDIKKELPDRITTGNSMAIWCPVHDKWERWIITETLWWALGTGFLFRKSST